MHAHKISLLGMFIDVFYDCWRVSFCDTIYHARKNDGTHKTASPLKQKDHGTFIGVAHV
jgi:hypothetical protein